MRIIFNKHNHSISKKLLLTGIELLILAILFWIFFNLTGSFLSKMAIKRLGQFTNTKIKTGSVEFNLDGEVIIRNILINPTKNAKVKEPILRAARVEAKFGVLSLLFLNPQLQEIEIRDFFFSALYDIENSVWNLSELTIRAPEGAGGKLPAVKLVNGRLEYREKSDNKITVAAATELEADFHPDEDIKNSYSFTIRTGRRGTNKDKSVLEGFWQPGKITLVGGLSSSNIAKFENFWDIQTLAAELNYKNNGNYILQLNIKDMEVKHRTEKQPIQAKEKGINPIEKLQKFVTELQPNGTVDIDIRAEGNINRLQKTRLYGQLHCKKVSVKHYKFPYLIENITGNIAFTKNTINAKELKGHHDSTDLTIDVSIETKPIKTLRLRVQSDNMRLNNDLYHAMEDKQQQLWALLSPKGTIGVDYRLKETGKNNKNEQLDISLKEVEFCCREFPYTIKNLTGLVQINNQKVHFNRLEGKWNNRSIILSGQAQLREQRSALYAIDLKAENIPLDKQLANALQPAQKVLYQKLNITGVLDAVGRIYNTKTNPKNSKFDIDATFRDTRLNPEQIGLEISNAKGTVRLTPLTLQIESFGGKAAGGEISAKGEISLEKKHGLDKFDLNIIGHNVYTEQGLLKVLPKKLKAEIMSFKASGPVNFSSNISNSKGDIAWKIDLECLGNTVNYAEFPYKVTDITGNVNIGPEIVKIEQLSGKPADIIQLHQHKPEITLKGKMDIEGGNFKKADLTINTQDIPVDKRLSRLTEIKIGEFITGGFLDIDFNSVKITDSNSSLHSNFKGSMRLHNTNLDISPKISQIDIPIENVNGLYLSNQGFQKFTGKIKSGKLRIGGKLVDKLAADIRWNKSQGTAHIKSIKGSFHDGTVFGDILIEKNKQNIASYFLQIKAGNVRLRNFLNAKKQRNIRPEEQTTGLMSGSLNVKGNLNKKSKRTGRLRVIVRDIEVGRLSPLAKIIQVLRLNRPSDYLFDRLIMDAYLKENYLIIDKFDLSGKTFALKGTGRVNTDSHHINLTLNARGKRLQSGEASVLSSLTDVFSPAVIRMNVTGQFSDPNITTTPLPILEKTINILGKPEQ